MTEKVSNVNLLTPAQFDPSGWALANHWLLEGQADDRRQMDSSVAHNDAPAAAKRAFARRTHQLMFKQWSQDRHD